MEVHPFWAHPLLLDGRRLIALIGDPPRTSLDQAVAASLRGKRLVEAERPGSRDDREEKHWSR
ncbi:hypothetical protein ACRBEV_09410 [Methylobacterium phyllosphaerae]